MTFYSFMLKRYQRGFIQVKCFLVFSGMFLGFFIVSELIRNWSDLGFYFIQLIGGWITWTFAEYILHRFWMHDKSSDSSLARTHHHHHTHPNEIAVNKWHRILMFLLCTTVSLLACRLGGYLAFVDGICFGALGYFLMHWLLHHRVSRHLFKKLLRYHIYHHCKYPNTCFGISVTWWDDLFHTVPSKPVITDRIVDFYFEGKH